MIGTASRVAAAAVATAAILQLGAAPAEAAHVRRAHQSPHSLSCDEIALRIQSLNGPIGDENNSWHQLQRNPTAQFVLFGVVTPDPEHDAWIDSLRRERVDLIHQAVEKDCAARQ